MNNDILYPLTLPQEAFYYDYLLNRNDSKYNMGGAFFLESELNVEIMRKAFNYVIKHYDILRVKFVQNGDQFYQLFKHEYEGTVNYYDFRNNKNPIQEALEFALKENKKLMPFEEDDIFFIMILQIEDKKNIIVPKFNHLFSDAMGMAIINQAISETYNSLLEKDCFPDLKDFSYVDFINDDLQYRDSDIYKKSFEYWKQKLAVLPEPFEFTSKKKSIKNVSLHTERITLNLHRVCFESILNIAYEIDSTTFQVILGLISTTIYRCYNRDEFIIGMPVLNRSNYKFRNTPGLFMNMMALKLKIDPDGTFEDIINFIKTEVREGYRHQRFPLRDIIKHLRNKSDFNNELFDVTVIYRKNDYSQRFGDAKINSITFDSEIRSESLSIEIDEYGDDSNVNIFFNYNPCVISEEEVVQFVHCFETILLDLIYFPEKKINELSILNEFDTYKILNEFNHSPEIITTEKTIVELFEEVAAKYPQAEAIIQDGEVISYKDLNEKGNSIAEFLLSSYNIQKEDIICLVSNRSINTIAAMLGIMKTGAAYLPIDSDLPIERIEYIIKNAGSKIVIHNGIKKKIISEVVIDLNEIPIKNINNIKIEIKQNNLAYVIYTSGSTGKPKGVLIEHRHFMNMFVNMIEKFGVKNTDRVLLFASIGFDGSMFEIFQALLTGALLVIVDKDKIQNPKQFIDYIEQNNVTVATLPPAYLSVLDKAELPSIHTLITAGEQAIVEDVNYYKQFKKYINGYGPTENSVCTSYYLAEKNIEYKQTVPIGRPSPNSKIYVLDKNLKPLPIGFSGELCVSGTSIARGYLNNDELTNQKFINNPFEQGLRLYKTGDLARWKQDGNIEFLGRIDDQVKINGNRIELGEIENRLSKFDNIKEAVVLDIKHGHVNALAAYIVSETEIDVNQIKLYLRRFLPEYMIPVHFVFIEKIPLTYNGKINKEILRETDLHKLSNKSEFKPAESEIEKKLINIFESVLDVKQVGIDDNFFQLGGESLKIARLIALIYKELKREIPFKVIFDSPTVRSIAAELELIKVSEYSEIPVAIVKEYYSLSHAQKRLWILTQNKENSPVYHMPVSFLLEGSIKLDLFEVAIKMIVERHESLRTIFIDVDGNPYQKVLNDYNLNLLNYDLANSKNKNETAAKIIKEKIIEPFDLTFDIPVRVNLIKLENNKHIFLLVLHHITADGISLGILLKELALLYNSLIKGSDIKLKPLRIQYKDYCEYENTIIKSKNYNLEKEYWLKKLQSPLSVLELPYKQPRPPIKTYSGEYLFYNIENNISQELINFCKDQNVSLYQIFVSLINILLSKYSSQEEIIIGSPVAGRNNADLENQVGIYLNTIALRNEIKTNNSFIEFLNEVKIVITEAISNSNYPFDLLITDLNTTRDTTRSPLFDVFVQLQNENFTNLELNELTSKLYEAEFKLNKFDLTFTFVDGKDNINFSIGYNTDLFNKNFINRMACHLKNILISILYNPNSQIKEIEYLDKSEKENLTEIGSGKYFEIEKQIIPALFEEQVIKTPENIALVYNDKKYNYKQLDEQANIIANEINLRLKVNPDDIIGIMTGRSELMIIGILGILKTGAAYLPIDSDYPIERISFMLKDSNAKLLLSENKLIDIANKAVELNTTEFIAKINVMDINSADAANNKRPELKIKVSNLVYVIYTSGSTGKPKGVTIEHQNLHNLVLGLADAIYKDFTTPLNIALISPFIFDASVKQIFFALLNGHCIDIVPEETKLNGKKLLEYFELHKINVSDGTPNHLEIIIDELKSSAYKYLPELFVIGGQQLLYQTVKELFYLKGEQSPVISNVYGPTECCDVSTCLNITRELFLQSELTSNVLPIGRPLNNVQIYILDSNNNQVPIGISGELCITGAGLSRGYINRPYLTAEKFIVDKILNQRIYKTGDIGHYLEDGNIILSGRTDDQIKLRGYRIELNEIENCIRSYENINLAAVIPIGEGNYLEIAAYYTASKTIDSEKLQQYLSLLLPSYMIPSYLIELKNIPLTVNGKVDKKLLPVPVKEILTVENQDLPGDKLEEKLYNIWKELLRVEKLSLTDDFFKLGGHSLIAIKLTSRIHKEFNIEINIWEVFKNPTISLLAKLLRSKNPSLFSPIEQIEKSEYYALSHSQRRLWLLAKIEGQNSLYNLPGIFQIKGNVNVQVLEDVFKSIVQRHESFRTSFIEIDGEPFQKITENVNISFLREEYTNKEFDENQLLKSAKEYFYYEFDLSNAPLINFKLIKVSKDSYYLLINMHHIISDGWSIEIILKELEVYYNSILNNLESPFLPLKIQYKDYAAWQNKILSDKSLEVIKEYWQKKLRKPRVLLDLPADSKRTDSFSNAGKLLSYELDTKAITALMEIGRNQNASLFMTLLSAVYILLYKYTGEEDIIIGSPVAGRQHFDLENQVGFFINTIVLRNEINPENTYQELLNKVKETLSDSFDNQVYPFDRLVDELDVDRIRNRNPLFDVMVAWMVKNGTRVKMKFNDIEISGIDYRESTSMFDLTFLFEEDEGRVFFAIEYNTWLFKQERIDRMSKHFNKLIESIVLNPKGKIKNFNIISEDEKENIISKFNKITQLFVEQKNVIELFNHQVEINKNEIALVYEGIKITYNELDKLSNRIANHLVEKINPNKEDKIAVIIDDPIYAAAALLAVIKTGAVYLPIMSNNPINRIAFILKDSNSKAVLVDNNILVINDELNTAEIDNTVVLNINESLSENDLTFEYNIEPTSLAYVIYTSGSTGKPKGVMIEHKALSNLILSLNKEIYCNYYNGLNELMISSFGFDVSIKQIFAAFCNGNTLHILENEKKLDPREIIKYIVNNKINVIDLTPSLFSVMIDEGFCETDKPDLKELFIGSEALPFNLVKTFMECSKNRNINVTNFYGPTECCVESSFFKFDEINLNAEYEIAPIGKPIINEQIYILDKYMNLCPIGIPGEICIAGEGLARQYLNDPEKTNEKFVQLPLLNGTRIYKTGDLGRTRSDGNIEFLGRMDEQIKIRGYRVELQEIEKNLRLVNEIKECAVTFFEKENNNELAAYYTSDDSIDNQKLKNILARFLPKYMIPEYFIRLDKIPLSLNGKVNKKMLPAPDGIIKQNNHREPQDEIEILIVKICSNVLKKENITIEDNFFEIGGHSLNAVRVISQIQKELNIDLALKEIFFNPILIDIAEKVKEMITDKKTIDIKELETPTIVPITDEELELLSNLKFDDDE
ncbi:MAG: amino acid adenylation domain-containing protein [bacterium]